MTSRPLILITGLNGYIAAHTALRFLKAGYSVRGTVRSLASPNSELIHAALNPFSQSHAAALSLIEVPDMTADGAFDEAVKGVDAIAHLASPVSMSPASARSMMDAAVKGTTSLLSSSLRPSPSSSSSSALRSIVYMSSISAVYSPKPGREDHIYAEKDWNDDAEDQVKREGDQTPGYVVYQASKAAAERAFWRFAEEEEEEKNKEELLGGRRVAVVGMRALCPAPVLGPPLYLPEPIESLSMRAKDVYDILNGGEVPPFNTIRGTFVDVRDVAELVFNAVERDLASQQGGMQEKGARERYVVVGGQRASPRRIAEVLREKFPDRKEAIRPLVGEPVPEGQFARFDVSKARELLGREWIGFEQSVVDTAKVFM